MITITALDNGYWEYKGNTYPFLEGALSVIAKDKKIRGLFFSESHTLAVLQSHGLVISLVNEDGSEVTW